MAHGSADLYFNDVHYLDGAKHFDEYMLTMTNENVLPNPLQNYELNDEWLRDRWSQTPWYDIYLQQQDASSSFWKNHSVKFQ